MSNNMDATHTSSAHRSENSSPMTLAAAPRTPRRKAPIDFEDDVQPLTGGQCKRRRVGEKETCGSIVTLYERNYLRHSESVSEAEAALKTANMCLDAQKREVRCAMDCSMKLS
jgi:hypothetical protein